VRAGDVIDFGDGVSSSVIEKANDGSALLHFHGDEPIEILLERAGRMPLPPYIASKRAADEEDRADYQTMFAREEGAVAAPTAALHFTPRLLGLLDARGIRRETLTLHVGAGTFLPVKVEDTSGHRMHAEWGLIDQATADRLNAVRASGGRLIAIGTTSLRLLESAAGEDGGSGSSRVTPRFSSRPDTVSRPSTGSSPISTCRARPCSAGERAQGPTS
jgi:S-adenosylmethionine:tRNA ribosyltransferase-isomerase